MIHSTRLRRSRPLANTTNASTTGANLLTCSIAPPIQPLNTCDSSSTQKNISSTGYCGASKCFLGDSIQKPAAAISMIGCSGRPALSAIAG